MDVDTELPITPPSPSMSASDQVPQTPSPLPGRAKGTPMLGDFSKLHALPLPFTPKHQRHDDESPVGSYGQSQSETDSSARLGDFARLFQRLGTPSDSVSDDPVTSPKPLSINLSTSRSNSISVTSVKEVRKTSLFTAEKDLEDGFKSDVDAPELTPGTTPPSSSSWEPSITAVLTGNPTTLPKKPPAVVASSVKSRKASKPKSKHHEQILSYQLTKYGTITPIYDRVRSIERQHESLSMRLVSQRTKDRLMAKQTPQVAVNGIHVFLDMSNINIGFQKALRARYSLHEESRFVPLPQLNLQFLTEILVRDRNVEVLNAGCSVPPGRPEPSFVHGLRQLAYRVDLRERKRVEEPTYGTGSSSSDEGPVALIASHVRYVEDLVDETLQIRIGESVMKYFQTQGTLVLATGDAKPAKYSDGFFTYADRALKMGWNVEVASWKSSLSSSWRNPGWTEQWGDRLRVLELDEFVDDLLLQAV